MLFAVDLFYSVSSPTKSTEEKIERHNNLSQLVVGTVFVIVVAVAVAVAAFTHRRIFRVLFSLCIGLYRLACCCVVDR